MESRQGAQSHFPFEWVVSRMFALDGLWARRYPVGIVVICSTGLRPR
jgi:hypothetical protein